jgi:hypothetical protein
MIIGDAPYHVNITSKIRRIAHITYDLSVWASYEIDGRVFYSLQPLAIFPMQSSELHSETNLA